MAIGLRMATAAGTTVGTVATGIMALGMIAACARPLGGPRPPVSNAVPQGTRGFDIVFPQGITEDGWEHLVIYFPMQGHSGDLRVTLFDAYAESDALRTVTATDHLASEMYEIWLPHGALHSGVVFMLVPPQPYLRVAQMTEADRERIDGIRGPRITTIAPVMDNGLDLDGDRRADLAFVVVFMVPSAPDRSRPSTWCAVERMGEQWKLSTCDGDVEEPPRGESSSR